MTEYIAAQSLSAGYSDTVIADLSFRVCDGEIMTLIGPNGSGKSTVLKTLSGALKKRGGTVFLCGRDMETVPAAERAKTVSAMLTERVTARLMTCREVVETGRYPYTGRFGRLTKKDRAAVGEAMALTAVTDIADADFSEISDGQRQLVLLAAAICREPCVLLLDEPVSYLDIRHKTAFLETIRTLADEKQIAVVMSMHELDLAEKISDYTVCVKNGGVFKSGAPRDVFTPETICALFDLPRGVYTRYFK